ncbi:MAG: MarR family transcriptional regulator [Atopobiaceae bacterium]|jgi:DNA-binding MarR family transcriptional regulator|nr:MarR family transcriptional regulator [Atopobiaceae bacterium]
MPETDAPFDPLSLDNQLCFPLYAASRELIRLYKPFLDPLDLTYPQYVTMMALWEHDGVKVGELGTRLHLDSATLTPLLKRLEAHGYVRRQRSPLDERAVIVSLTDEGRELRERALSVPPCIAGCLSISPEEAMQLKALLEKLIATMQ